MNNQVNKITFGFFDAIIVSTAFVISFFLRFDFLIPISTWNEIFRYLPIVIFSKLFSFFILGLYKGMWRYTSLSDLINIVKASSLGSLLSLSILALSYGLSGFPRSVIFIDFIISTIMLSSLRTAVRLYYSNYTKLQIFRKDSKRKKIVIIGAGNSSEKIIREIKDNHILKYIVIGLFDDDESKVGATIHGVPILGPIEQLSNLRISFDEIIICIPSATSDEMRRIIAIITFSLRYNCSTIYNASSVCT